MEIIFGQIFFVYFVNMSHVTTINYDALYVTSMLITSFTFLIDKSTATSPLPWKKENFQRYGLLWVPFLLHPFLACWGLEWFRIIVGWILIERRFFFPVLGGSQNWGENRPSKNCPLKIIINSKISKKNLKIPKGWIILLIIKV